MKITETYVRKLIREALVRLVEGDINREKALGIATEEINSSLDEDRDDGQTGWQFVASGLGLDLENDPSAAGALEKLGKDIASGISDTKISDILGGNEDIGRIATDVVDSALSGVEDHLGTNIDTTRGSARDSRNLLLQYTEDAIDALLGSKSEILSSKNADKSPAAVAAGGNKNAGIPYSKNVEEIQKLIGGYAGGITPDGKWGGKTQEAFKAFLKRLGPTLVGATVEQVLGSWKTNGPKITKVNDKDVSPRYTPDAAGVLRFVKDVAPARSISPTSTEKQTRPLRPPPVSGEIPGLS